MIKTPCDIYRMEAVEAFRLGMEGKGSDAMMRLMDCMAPLLESNAAHLGTDDAELLNLIAEAQQRGDNIFVADLLEYMIPDSAFGMSL